MKRCHFKNFKFLKTLNWNLESVQTLIRSRFWIELLYLKYFKEF